MAETIKMGIEKERSKGNPLDYDTILSNDAINTIIEELENGQKPSQKLQNLIFPPETPFDSIKAMARMARTFDFLVIFILMAENNVATLHEMSKFLRQFLKCGQIIENLSFYGKKHAEIVENRVICNNFTLDFMVYMRDLFHNKWHELQKQGITEIYLRFYHFALAPPLYLSFPVLIDEILQDFEE